MHEVSIRGEIIQLGQLLKLVGLIDSGAEAKELLAQGAVQVNGEVETRRGRKLRVTDRVAVAGEELWIVSSSAAPSMTDSGQ